MLKNICKSIATMTFLVLMSPPAAAQLGVHVDAPLPGLEIRVGHKAPPKLRIERKPHRPGKDYQWAQGSWNWQGSDWAWAPGRWERPGAGVRWVNARYAREGAGWRHEPGHWSNQQIVEGDDYRKWKSEGHDRDHNDHH